MESVDGGDLTELPEELMQRILSFLSIEDEARASCLSKRWLHAWQRRSILRFDEYVYYENPRNARRQEFFDYVNRVLQRYREEKIGIHKFELGFATQNITEWIQVAIQNGVKMLKLTFYLPYCFFVLPGIIFEANSPLRLSIGGRYSALIKLPESMSVCQYIKSLHVRHINLDGSDFQRLASSCPMVEDLVIEDCLGDDTFKVTNLSKLKQFEFRRSRICRRTVEVEANPKLEVFKCSRLKNLSMGASQNLKQLKLFDVGITEEFFLDFKYRFPNLEVLTIHGSPGLKRLRLSSGSLKKMYVSFYFWVKIHIDAPNMTQFELVNRWRDLEELQIHAPRMTLFKYRGDFIKKVSFTSAASNCCSYIKLLHYDYTYDLSYFSDLREFLESFSQSKMYVNLGGHFGFWNNFGVKEPEDLELFNVSVQVHLLTIAEAAPEKFLDGVFSICHPKTIIIKCRGDHHRGMQNVICPRGCPELAEFISKYLMVTSDNENNSPHMIMFWKRIVKKIEFQEDIQMEFLKDIRVTPEVECRKNLMLEMET